MRLDFWCHWSIRARLISITILPVLYLFCTFVWYSYQSRFAEVREELAERGALVAKVLADSSEFNLVSRKYDALQRNVDGLLQSDPSIYRIEVLDSGRRPLLRADTRTPMRAEPRSFEAPVVKRLLWVRMLAPDGTPLLSTPATGAGDARRGGMTLETVGHIRVTMSPTAMLTKQAYRFSVELVVAGLGLAVCGLLALQLSKRFTNSLQSSMEAVREIRGGNYQVALAVSTGGEIGDLQASIQEMAASLYQATQNLENQVAARTRDLEASRNDALRSDAEKRKLIQKVNTIVEDERKSIALEIHDELNAALIAARLDAQRIVMLCGQQPASVAGDEIKTRAQSLIKQMLGLYNSGRSLVRQLRPEVLDMLGLHGAVEEMLRHYDHGHPDCRFTLVADGDFSALDSGIAISAYRIIQEALSNVVKHAHASQAQVTLSLDAAALQIQVSDDGAGFVADGINSVGGIGIVGMRERVYAFDGEMVVRSGAGEGSRIDIRLPLPAPQPGPADRAGVPVR
jgi:two-component system sensor histidine kinase UhpB